MSEEFEIFSDFLKAHKLRMTEVRKAIIRYIKTTTSGFSVPELQSAIRVEGLHSECGQSVPQSDPAEKSGTRGKHAEKGAGETFFRLKKTPGRVYEIHCPGCRKHLLIQNAALNAAVKELCRQYDLQEDGILVRIDARHKRHTEKKEK